MLLITREIKMVQFKKSKLDILLWVQYLGSGSTKRLWGGGKRPPSVHAGSIPEKK